MKNTCDDSEGISLIVVASDIPHWDNEFPENAQKIQAREDLSPQAKTKILYVNARTMYQR